MTEHHLMIEDCEARQERLTEWEQEFIASIGERIAERPLTEKQAAKLEAIWNRVTTKG